MYAYWTFMCCYIYALHWVIKLVFVYHSLLKNMLMIEKINGLNDRNNKTAVKSCDCLFLPLKLTCHINRRHICFDIKSISVHQLLWMNVMLDFIYMVLAELLSTGYKRKIQNDNVCRRRESNQRPLAFQRVPLTTQLSGLLMRSD